MIPLALVVAAAGCAVSAPCDDDGSCPASARCVEGQCAVTELVVPRDRLGAFTRWRLPGGTVAEGEGEGEGEGETQRVTFPGGFEHRRLLTVHTENVQGYVTLRGFPLLVRVEAPELRHVDHGGFVTSGFGGDIAFFSDATMSAQLAHDRVRYDPARGLLEAWVELDLSPYVDAEIALAYGRPDVVASAGAPVWDAYEAVWHLDDNELDATGRHHGTAEHLEPEDVLPGVIGAGRRFDGDDEGIRVPCADLEGRFSATIEAWGMLDADNASLFPRLFHMGREEERVFELFLTDSSSTQATFRVNFDAWGSERAGYLPSFNYGEWHHFAGVLDAAKGLVSLYVDGERIADDDYTGPISYGYSPCHIGNWDSAPVDARNWNGVIDEVRVSHRALSEAWIAAVAANGRDPESFVSVGADETP